MNWSLVAIIKKKTDFLIIVLKSFKAKKWYKPSTMFFYPLACITLLARKCWLILCFLIGMTYLNFSFLLNMDDWLWQTQVKHHFNVFNFLFETGDSLMKLLMAPLVGIKFSRSVWRLAIISILNCNLCENISVHVSQKLLVFWCLIRALKSPLILLLMVV